MTEQQLHTEDLAGRAEAAETTHSSRREFAAEAADRTDRTPTVNAAAARDEDGDGWRDLLGDTTEFSTRWDAIQAGFVDEPRRAVEEADALVARVIQRLADSFSTERSRLESQWSRGDQVNTEDLRVSLRRYRSFFHQLLMKDEARL